MWNNTLFYRDQWGDLQTLFVDARSDLRKQWTQRLDGEIGLQWTVLEDLLERPALDPFHDDPVTIFVLYPIVDLHDGRMTEASDGTSLALKPGARLGRRIGISVDLKLDKDAL